MVFFQHRNDLPSWVRSGLALLTPFPLFLASHKLQLSTFASVRPHLQVSIQTHIQIPTVDLEHLG